MIENVDDNIARLLAKLDEWGSAANPLFIFLTDNGGAFGTKIFTAGMRGGAFYDGWTKLPTSPRPHCCPGQSCLPGATPMAALAKKPQAARRVSDFQPVAETMHGEQVPWIAGCVFDFLAELHHELIERARGAVVFDAPDFI